MLVNFSWTLLSFTCSASRNQ